MPLAQLIENKFSLTPPQYRDRSIGHTQTAQHPTLALTLGGIVTRREGEEDDGLSYDATVVVVGLFSNR